MALTFYVANEDFGAAAASHFISVLVNQDNGVGPNALVIVSALATEFASSLSIGLPELLLGFAMRLKDCLRRYIRKEDDIVSQHTFE